MKHVCSRCKFDLWELAGTPKVEGPVLVCRRCDTTAQPGNRRVGPPNAPGTAVGWFGATFKDIP